MKRGYKSLALILWLLFLTPTAFATDIADRSFDIIDGKSVENAVPDEARELLDGAGINQDLDFTSCVKTLFNRAFGAIGEYFKQSLAGGLKLFAVAGAVCAGVRPDRQNTKGGRHCRNAGGNTCRGGRYG